MKPPDPALVDYGLLLRIKFTKWSNLLSLIAEDGRARLQPCRYDRSTARALAPEGPHQLAMTSVAKATLLDTRPSGTTEVVPSRFNWLNSKQGRLTRE